MFGFNLKKVSEKKGKVELLPDAEENTYCTKLFYNHKSQYAWQDFFVSVKKCIFPIFSFIHNCLFPSPFFHLPPLPLPTQYIHNN